MSPRLAHVGSRRRAVARTAAGPAAGLALGMLVAVIAVALTGCGPAEPAAEPTATPTASSTPTPTREPTVEAAPEFAMPADCTEVLPTSRVASFADQGMDLLGGPGGRYGEDYLLEPTPEEQAGGISCIWGDEDVPSSTVTVSVAPVTASIRSTIVQSLVAQGLNETVVDGAITYSEIGDEVSAPALLNVLRTDSWISVIEAVGGEAFFDEASVLADEVAASVYSG